MERIVLYGGSFDPLHHAHIEIVKRLSEKFDKVIVVPTGKIYLVTKVR